MKVGVHLIPNRCMREVGLSQKHWLRRGMNCSRMNSWTFSSEYGPVFIFAQPSHPSNQKSWKIGLPAAFANAVAASKSVSQGIPAMAVLLSDGEGGTKWMEVGKPHARFVDLTGHVSEPVVANQDGWGEFRCSDASVSVWIEE